MPVVPLWNIWPTQHVTRKIGGQILTFAEISARFFTETLTVALFMALSVCYTVQGVFAHLRARERLDESPSDVSVTLRDVVLFHEGGRLNVWTFFALAILSPVLLSSIGNMTPLTGVTSQVQYDRPAAAMYFLCLAVIAVLLTLELSHVYQLRRTAREWIPMLVVSIALDILTLLIFLLFVKNPSFWAGPVPSANPLEANLLPGGLSWETEVSMVGTTILALFSSFWILVYARTTDALRVHPADLTDVLAGMAQTSSSPPTEEQNTESDENP